MFLSEKEIFFGGVYDGQCWEVLAGTETHIPYLMADVRIMHHINDGVMKHGWLTWHRRICDLIFCCKNTWNLQKLFLKFGSRENKKIVPIHLLFKQLHYNLVSRLPAIHALSGVTPRARWVLSFLEYNRTYIFPYWTGLVKRSCQQEW